MAPPAAAQHEALEGLDNYIEAAVADWEVPGLAIAVVKDGEVMSERGFGVKELGGQESVDEHTLFAIASASKAFTVAALGMLVDEGKLDWDDPVCEAMELRGFTRLSGWRSDQFKLGTAGTLRRLKRWSGGCTASAHPRHPTEGRRFHLRGAQVEVTTSCLNDVGNSRTLQHQRTPDARAEIFAEIRIISPPAPPPPKYTSTIGPLRRATHHR